MRARTSFAAQQTAKPADPARANNLYQPVKGNFSAHGSFDERAFNTCIQFWLRSHSPLLALGALLLGGFAWGWFHRPK